MGFFASRPTIAFYGDAADERRVEPEWFGPPRGVLAGSTPLRAVIFRTDDAILFVDHFNAYPTGVEFSLELLMRDRDAELWDPPWERHGRRRHHDPELPDDFLRLGIVFADGASWTNFDTAWPQFDDQPAGPVVISRGGGGGDGGYQMNQWLWPLPPDGPLTFIAEWPALGVGETVVAVDAGELRHAASRAEVVWTEAEPGTD